MKDFCRNYPLSSSIGGAILFTATLVSGTAYAGPPMTCTTPSGITVKAVPGPDGVFPTQTPCSFTYTDSSGNTITGNVCSEYDYKIIASGTNLDHLLFALSANSVLLPDSTLNSQWSPSTLGAGDSKTNFLEYSADEYPIRSNANASVYSTGFVVQGAAVAKTTTALMTSGKVYESCAIAGPGISVSQFASKPLNTYSWAVGGKCLIEKTFDAQGNLINAQLAPQSANDNRCAPHPGTPTINGLPLQDNSDPNGITYGTGTCTCYGPSSTISPAMCFGTC
jgi:hypothetical protein